MRSEGFSLRATRMSSLSVGSLNCAHQASSVTGPVALLAGDSPYNCGCQSCSQACSGSWKSGPNGAQAAMLSSPSTAVTWRSEFNTDGPYPFGSAGGSAGRVSFTQAMNTW